MRAPACNLAPCTSRRGPRPAASNFAPRNEPAAAVVSLSAEQADPRHERPIVLPGRSWPRTKALFAASSFPTSTAESEWNLHVRTDADIPSPANDVNSTFPPPAMSCGCPLDKLPGSDARRCRRVACGPRSLSGAPLGDMETRTGSTRVHGGHNGVVVIAVDTIRRSCPCTKTVAARY